MKHKSSAIQHAAGMVAAMVRDLKPEERRAVKDCALRVQEETAFLGKLDLAYIAMQLAMVRIALIDEKRRERESKKRKGTKKAKKVRS